MGLVFCTAVSGATGRRRTDRRAQQRDLDPPCTPHDKHDKKQDNPTVFPR